MAKNIGILVSLLIIAMDITAGVLGIEAQEAQNKVRHLNVLIFECRNPSHKAFELALAAAILLALAHVMANLLGGCICIRSKQDLNKASANKQLALASLIFSWIILAVGFSMLIMGAMANSPSRSFCGLSYHRILTFGGILCFIHGPFAIAYYVSSTAAKREEKTHGGQA